MRPITAIATPAAATQVVNLDSWWGAGLGIQVVPAGGATFTIDYSFDSPNDLVTPIPAGSMFFDTTMVPASAVNGSLAQTFTMAAAPRWMRLRLLNALGQVRAVFLQYADHTPQGGSQSAPVVTSVWSAADATANAMTLSNGGLTVTPSGASAWQSIRGSISRSAGKLYVEFLNTGVMTGTNNEIGLASSGFNPVGFLGSSIYSCGISSTIGNQTSVGFASNYVSTLAAPAQSDVWALAVDFTAGFIWIASNNVWSNSSNPATASLPIITFVPATVGALFPAMSFFGAGEGIWTLQPNAASQKYAAPVGFSGGT